MQTRRARNHRCTMSYFFLFTALQPGQEEGGQVQRPEVREEDLTETKNNLGLSGPAKGKTFQVMEDCGEDTHKHISELK